MDIPKQNREAKMALPELLYLKPSDYFDYEIENATQIRNAITYLKKSRGMKFVTRSIPKSKKLRVWRV
jgi:hypothetical protein